MATASSDAARGGCAPSSCRARPPASRRLAALVAVTALVVGLMALVGAPVAQAAAPIGSFATFSGAISGPSGIVVGSDKNLWFTNRGNSTIGRVTPTGTVTPFTGVGVSSPVGITLGSDGNVWFANFGNNSIGKIDPSGVVANYTHATISLPLGMATGSDGNVWFTNNGNSSIGRITPAGVVTNYTAATISFPSFITRGPDGNVWFLNNSGSVGKITPAGVVTNYTDVKLAGISHLAAGPDGNVWFSAGAALGTITPAGGVTLKPSAKINGVGGLATGPDGNVWFTNVSNIGQMTPAGAVTTFDSSNFSGPGAITAGPDGNMWFCNYGNGTISYVGTEKGSGYHSVVPARILDSRLAVGWSGKLAAGAKRDLQVTGLGGASNVPAGSAAVVMNVTATGSSAGSFVSVWPTGAVQPASSNLNFGAGETIPNLVTVKLGTGGKVSFATATGSVDIVGDVVGYYDDGTGPGDLFTPITPTRMLDSRTPTGNWAGKLPAGAPRDLNVRKPANPTGVPATATAVIANVTATASTAASFLSVWPSGVTQPNVSNLNFATGQTIPNLSIVKIGSNGAIRFANAIGSVDVVVDVVGYFDPTTGSKFHAINPTRVLDDRLDVGLSGPWGPNQSRALTVAGTALKIPQFATGLVANVTATAGSTGSFVTVYPSGVTRPTASNVNFGPGQTIPNLVTVGLSNDGTIYFYNSLGSVDLIADAVGYYAQT